MKDEPTGNKKDEPILDKTPDDSATFLSEILGDAALRAKMMPTGAILEMMDLLAGRIAWNHVGGPVATVSVDRIDLHCPISNGDLVRVEGRPIAKGNSSLTIHCVCKKHDMYTRKFVITATAFITLVALDQNMRPKKNIHGLQLVKKEDIQVAELYSERKKLFEQWNKMMAATNLTTDEQLAKIYEEKEAEDRQFVKREYLTIPETEVVMRKQPLPKHLNFNQTFFGGNIIQVMEETAVYCAKRFTQNYGHGDMLTLCMNRVSFTQPITPKDILEMRASVVYVRKFILEVEVVCYVDRKGAGKPEDMIRSHTGHFTVLNVDSIGFKIPIAVGVKIDARDGENLERYKRAKDRFLFDITHPSRNAETLPLELRRTLSADDEKDDDVAGRKFYLN